MIKVYGFPKTRSIRITWLLEELAQPYEYCLVDFTKGDSKSEKYLSINPAGKVPAIQDDELVMTESGAIVAYLAEKYGSEKYGAEKFGSEKNGSEKLIPASATKARAKYEQWSYFAMAELEQPLWTMGKHKFALPKDLRVPEVLATAAWEFQKSLTLLSDGLADNDYILGDQFSAVDILLAHTLRWGLNFGQPIEQANLMAYLERMEVRPALKNAKAREQSELK